MKYIVLGYGGRGQIYTEILRGSDRAELVALCDTDARKRALAKARLGLADDRIYADEDTFFAQPKTADICFVCTQDRQHTAHAVKAMERGYDLLLEKPIATNLDDCMTILETGKRLNRKIFVCHVLRYAPFYYRLKKELDSGKYGKIVTLNMTENVAYWHQAHSFVRGNWNNSDTSCPMIVAKCCHDLDMIQFLLDGQCEYVSSMGSLQYFGKDHAPAGCADRCIGCKYQGTCVYDAEKFYIHDRAAKGNFVWPVDIVSCEGTVDAVRRALETGPYGRCVYKCGNNVVDHQVVNLLFADGATAHLTMTAFSGECYREIHVHAENGDIYGDTRNNILHCRLFGQEPFEININNLHDTAYGHGGGDRVMLNDIIEYYEKGTNDALTTIEKSFASHVMAFKAEESRIKNGALMKV